MALNGIHKWAVDGARYPPSQHSRSLHGNSSWATREARPVDVFLALAVALVVIAVLCIAGLAIYLGAMRIDARSADIVLDGRLQVSGGAPSAPQLQLALLNSTTSAFQQAARFYTALLERVYKRSELGPALRAVAVRGFSLRSSTLVVFFRLQLDRRRTTTIEVEDVARSILVQEATALKPIAFTDMQMDADHIVIKRHEEPSDGVSREEQDSERRNATRLDEPHGPSANRSTGTSTATTSTVTTRPLVLSTLHRSTQAIRPGRRPDHAKHTTTTSTTTTPTLPSTWDDTYTAPATEVIGRNRMGPPIMAMDTTTEETTTTYPSRTEAASSPSTEPLSTSLPSTRPMGVVEPIAKEGVVVDPWNAPYGGAASNRPMISPPLLVPNGEDEDALSSWRPVMPTHHQQPILHHHIPPELQIEPILLPTGEDDDSGSVLGVAEVVAVPSSALEASANLSAGFSSDIGVSAPLGPPLQPLPVLPPVLPEFTADRLSLSPAEAFRQDLLMERTRSNLSEREPVNTYVGDVRTPVNARVPVRPSDAISKISLIVSGDADDEPEADTSILQTDSGSIVIKDERQTPSSPPPTPAAVPITTQPPPPPSTTTTTTTTSTTASPTTPIPTTTASTTTAKLELAKAEMRNSNIRMPGLFSLPDLPLLHQFPNLDKTLLQESRIEEKVVFKQDAAVPTTTSAAPSTTTTTIVTTSTDASPVVTTAKPAPSSSEESVTIVTLLPVRSNSGLRRPLRRKPQIHRTSTHPPPPPSSTASTTTASVSRASLTSPGDTVAGRPSTTPTAISGSTLSKREENSVNILSSLKLMLESRQSLYTSTAAPGNHTAPNGTPGHVDRITHFIIPPEKDQPALGGGGKSPLSQRVNVAHIERVTTEAPPSSTEASLQGSSAKPEANVTRTTPPRRTLTRTPPLRGVTKGNKTSTQIRGQPHRPGSRPANKRPASQQPRPQQSSSKLKAGTGAKHGGLKAGVLRANVSVSQVRQPAARRPTQGDVSVSSILPSPDVVYVQVGLSTTRPPSTAGAASDDGDGVKRPSSNGTTSSPGKDRVAAEPPSAVSSTPTPSFPTPTAAAPTRAHQRQGKMLRRTRAIDSGPAGQGQAPGRRGEAAGTPKDSSATTPEADSGRTMMMMVMTPAAEDQVTSTLGPPGPPRDVERSLEGLGAALGAGLGSDKPQGASGGSATDTNTGATKRPQTIATKRFDTKQGVIATTTTVAPETTKRLEVTSERNKETTAQIQAGYLRSSAKLTIKTTTNPTSTTVSTVTTKISTSSTATVVSTATTKSLPTTKPKTTTKIHNITTTTRDVSENKFNYNTTTNNLWNANSTRAPASTEPLHTEGTVVTTKSGSKTTHTTSTKATPTNTTTTTSTPPSVTITTTMQPSMNSTVSGPSPLEKTEAQRNRTAQLVAAIRAAVGLPAKSVSSSSSKLDVNRLDAGLLHKVLHKVPTSISAHTHRNVTTTPAPVQSTTGDCGVRCGDGSCVAAVSRCNQLVDCPDGADERGCSCADYLRARFLHRKLCDGVVDCWDFSDESNCDWCVPGRYVCPNSRVCVDTSRLCDGHRDCPYGDDEKQCVAVAPDVQAANNVIYHSRGFVMVRRSGVWGKLCASGVEVEGNRAMELGRVICKAMTFSGVEAAVPAVENGSDVATPYFEMDSNAPLNKRHGGVFVPSECPEKKVLRVSCQSLRCGERPQAMSNWGRMAGDALPGAGRHARIVGGSNAGPGAWPWQAALYKEGEFQCGATLISDRWLLSAGHCFYHALDDYWVARLGALRRGSDLASPYEQLRPLAAIVLHPGYVDAGFFNDISLLRMKEPVSFSDFVRPICLPPAGAILKDGTMCTVVGWGQLFEVGRVFPDTLQEVQLPTISTAECRRRTLFLPLYRVTDNMFCAGFDRGGRDACLGDSGGPLMCQESDSRWTLHGVTSNGYGCARADRPGVYTKVANYVRWMHLVMEASRSGSGAAAQALRDAKTVCRGHRCPLGQCLPANRVCNGFIECSDGSDEKGCWSSLLHTESPTT